MALIRTLSWNIQVYGPQKYSHPVNAVALVNFIGAVAASVQANLVVVYETMSSVAAQVEFSVNEGLQAATGAGGWEAYTTQARVNGDRESYGFYWDPGANFAPALDAAGQPVKGLSTLEFPNNFSSSHGRRAAYATFLTTDTNRYFTTTAYHAPPNARAIQGLSQLAQMREIYYVPNPAAPPPATLRVNARLLAGDYNLDINVQPDYSWLTSPEPAIPPPVAPPGEGAGTRAATNGDTELMSYSEANRRWPGGIAGWSPNVIDYRRNMAIDTIFSLSPAGPGPWVGSVVDVLGEMTTPGTLIRQAAENFGLVRAGGGPAFPNAAQIPAPLNVNLNFACCAYLLYRYAVSDHLPVLLPITI